MIVAAVSADAELYALVGHVYVNMGKLDKAVQSYLQQIHHVDDSQEVDRIYQRILELDPTNEQALHHLGGEPEVSKAPPSKPATVSIPDADSGLSDENEMTGSSGIANEYAAAINEASVYLKYGILDRAIEQLQTVRLRAIQKT